MFDVDQFASAVRRAGKIPKVTAKTLFNQCLRIGKRLEKLEGDEYFAVQESLREVLKALLDQDFTTLSKRDFLIFISMCSAHRPVPPHVLLTKISMAVDRGV